MPLPALPGPARAARGARPAPVGRAARGRAATVRLARRPRGLRPAPALDRPGRAEGGALPGGARRRLPCRRRRLDDQGPRSERRRDRDVGAALTTLARRGRIPPEAFLSAYPDEIRALAETASGGRPARRPRRDRARPARLAADRLRPAGRPAHGLLRLGGARADPRPSRLPARHLHGRPGPAARGRAPKLRKVRFTTVQAWRRDPGRGPGRADADRPRVSPRCHARSVLRCARSGLGAA